MNLPTDTLDGIIKSNRWCSYGRRRARVFHRIAKRPERINAQHILNALVYLSKRHGATYRHPNHFQAVAAICRLIDVETANRIMRTMKNLALPYHDGRHWSWERQRYITRKRYYPNQIVSGHRLYNLLRTYSPQNQLKILCIVLNV